MSGSPGHETPWSDYWTSAPWRLLEVERAMTEDRQADGSESRVDELVHDLYVTALEFDWALKPEDIVDLSRRPHAKPARRRVGVVLVAAAILVVFFVPFPHLSVFDRLGDHPGVISTGAPKTPACKIEGLEITYFGGSGAAGTAITSFKMTNTSKVACVLSGYPTLRFFTGPPSAPRSFAVKISHNGPGIAFASHPRPVLLTPSGSSGSAGKGAGLLFTSGDFASNGSGDCPQVTSIVLRLGDSGPGKRVFLWYPTNVCRSPAWANVSSFFPASSLDSYTLPTISPYCAMSDLLVSAGKGEAGLGHLGLPILFRNVAPIPCAVSSYPSVGFLDKSGRRVATAKDTSSGYLGGLPQGTANLLASTSCLAKRHRHWWRDWTQKPTAVPALVIRHLSCRFLASLVSPRQFASPTVSMPVPISRCTPS